MIKMPQVKIPPRISEQALIRLMRVGDQMWRRSDDRFARWGISDNHYNVLRILNGRGEALPQVEIGRLMLSSRANVTKLIDLLESRGFVRRLATADRRVNLVALTEAGADFLRETLPDVIAHAEQALSLLSRSEQKTLFRLLGRLNGEKEKRRKGVNE